jgi:hypothetical protein
VCLKAGIDGLTLEGQDPEDAFVDPAEGLLADKSFESFNTKSKLAECQIALLVETERLRSRSKFSANKYSGP